MTWSSPGKETLRAYVLEAARRADDDGLSLSSHMREDFGWPPLPVVETMPEPPHNLRTTSAIDKPEVRTFAPSPQRPPNVPPMSPKALDKPQRRGTVL